MRRLVSSSLIRIYTICHSVLDFSMTLLYVTMDMSKIKIEESISETQGWKGETSEINVKSFKPNWHWIWWWQCLAKNYSFEYTYSSRGRLHQNYTKTWQGNWDRHQTESRWVDDIQHSRSLIRIFTVYILECQSCSVCLNYWKLRVKWNSLKSPFRTIFPANTRR